MSSVIDKIRKNKRATTFSHKLLDEKSMLRSSGKVSRLQVREGKRNDGSKIALVSLIPEPESNKCVPEKPSCVSSFTRGWAHECIRDELKAKLRRDANLSIKPNDRIDRSDVTSDSSSSFKSHKFDKSDVSLIVTHYEDPCSFWAQDCDDADDVMEIEHILNKKCCLEIPTKENLREEELYVVTSAIDGKSYRCRIVQIVADDEYFVQYIDYGNNELVLRNQFLRTPTELINFSPMAKLYRLYRLKPHKGLKGKAMHKEGVSYLKKIFSSDLVHGRVFKNVIKHGSIPIQIRIEGLDVAEELLSRDYATTANYARTCSNSPPRKDNVVAAEGDLNDKLEERTNFSDGYPSCASDDFHEAGNPMKRLNLSQDTFSVHSQTKATAQELPTLEVCKNLPQVDLLSLQQRIDELEKFNTHLILERNGALAEVNSLKKQLVVSDAKIKEIIPHLRKTIRSDEETSSSSRCRSLPNPDEISRHQRKSLPIVKQSDETIPERKTITLQDEILVPHAVAVFSVQCQASIPSERSTSVKSQEETPTESHVAREAYEAGHFHSQLNTLLALIHQVRLLRRQIPFRTDQIDPIENICLFIQKHMDRINLDDIVEMLGINKASNDYNKAQQAISACTSREELPALTIIRDAARITLHNSISQFVTEIGSTTLDERLKDLTALRKLIGDLFGVYLKVKITSSPNLDTLMAHYREWKEKHKETFINARLETNVHHSALMDSWNSIRQSLMWSSDVVKLPSTQYDLFAQMQSLKVALVKELANCCVEKMGGHATLAMIVQKLNAEIEVEGAQIKAIKKQQMEYSQMIAVLSPWLDKIPNFSPLLHFDQEIKSLKSQLRHKLADMNDLEEEPLPDKTVLEQMKKELTAIRNKLHAAFATGDRLSAKFIQLSKVHYPELPLLYPTLDHEILNPNIVKESRELIYYDVEPFTLEDGHVSVFKTRILDKDFTLKEVSMDNIVLGEFVNRVSSYASITSKQLVPITAILCPKDKRKVYLQMPYYEYNLLERNPSTLPLEVKCRILTGLAKALAKLHAHNVIHGALHPRNVLISDDEVFLAPYNFASNIYQRVCAGLKALPVNGVSFLAPELTSNKKRFTTSADMFSLGCIALVLFYPTTLFENDKFKIPNCSGLEETHFLRCIGNLLDKDPEKRMTAEQMVSSYELLDPCTIFNPATVLEPVVCDRLMAPLFAFPDEDRRDVKDCVVSEISSASDDDEDDDEDEREEENDDEDMC